MAIQLSPELESRIQEKVDRGYFDSAEHVIETALYELEHRRLELPPADELEALLDEAEAEFARGEFYTPEQVREHMDRVKAQLRRG